MVNMRQALGVDDFNQMSNYTGQLQNKRRSVGQKDYGLGGKALDMAAALGDAYNQYQPPETALGMMALPAKAVYGLGNMIVQDVGDKTKSIMGTDINNPAAMNQAATDAFGLAADTMAGGGVVSRMTDMPQGAILGANVFQGGPHKYGPEGAAESLKHMSKGEGAQAYGWGRYDAENDIVAGQYRANVRNIDEEAFKKAGFTDSEIKTARQYASQYLPEESDMAASAFSHWLGKELKPETNLAFKEAMGEGSYLYKHDLPDEDIARYMDWDAPLSEQPQSVQDALSGRRGLHQQELLDADARMKTVDEEISAIASRNPMEISDTGTVDEQLASLFRPMSEADDLAHTKLWDERQILREKALGRFESTLAEDAFDKLLDYNTTGEDLYKNLIKAKGKEGASKLLEEAGIPGLKYFDGMSRGINRTGSVEKVGDKWTATIQGPHSSTNKNFSTKPEADKWVKSKVDGTRNFVTWDQDVLNRMKLLERNGESMVDALSGVNNK